MAKGLTALCIVAAIQVCAAYEIGVPVFKQDYVDVDTHIIGGETATRGQFPFQAGIFIDDNGFCGGSLISRSWILTAAHCIADFRRWNVILGAQNIRDNNEPGRISMAAQKAIVHQSYNGPTLAHDVGLLSLPQQVELSAGIAVIRLPPRSFQNVNFSGRSARVSGWGKISDSTTIIHPILQFVDLNIINIRTCQAAYGNLVVTKNQICCSGADRKSICNGDSGGPLTIGSGKNTTLLGIVSFISLRGCAMGYPAGFSAVPAYLDWIGKQTGIPIQDF